MERRVFWNLKHYIKSFLDLNKHLPHGVYSHCFSFSSFFGMLILPISLVFLLVMTEKNV